MKKLSIALVLFLALSLSSLHAMSPAELLEITLIKGEYEDTAGEGPRYGEFNLQEYEENKRQRQMAIQKKTVLSEQLQILEKAFYATRNCEDPYYNEA